MLQKFIKNGNDIERGNGMALNLSGILILILSFLLTLFGGVKVPGGKSSVSDIVFPIKDQKIEWGIQMEELKHEYGEPDAVEEMEDGLKLIYYSSVETVLGKAESVAFLIGTEELQDGMNQLYTCGLTGVELTFENYNYEILRKALMNCYGEMDSGTVLGTPTGNAENSPVYAERFAAKKWYLEEISQEQYQKLMELIKKNSLEFMLAPQESLYSIFISGENKDQSPTIIRFDATWAVQLHHAEAS